MSDPALHAEPSAAHRDALGQLASMPLDELRRLAALLDDESRIVRVMLRERTRRPARLALVVAEGRP